MRERRVCIYIFYIYRIYKYIYLYRYIDIDVIRVRKYSGQKCTGYILTLSVNLSNIRNTKFSLTHI